MNRKEFGLRLRLLRTSRQMTQEGLAEASGLAADSIRRLEYGRFSPSLESLTKLAQGLGISTIDVLVDNYDPNCDLAALIRQLPEPERQLALSIVGTLRVHVAMNAKP